MKGNRYIVVEQEYCGTCVHYRQHYVLSDRGRFSPLWYGHCGTPRMKQRQPDEACPRWGPVQPPDEPEDEEGGYPPSSE